jgi:hypothetical protein
MSISSVGNVTMKETETGDDTPMTLLLQTGETDIVAADVLGKIQFQAPDEAGGTDAILVAAEVAAISEGTFAADNNATKLSFKTAASGAVSEKMSISSAGVVALSATTEASATGTAALTTAGGLGVAKDVWIGDDLVLDSDAAVISFGDNQDVLLTHVADTGLTMSVTGNNVAQLGVVQDKDDASTGPVINLTRYSASPAAADGGGIIQFVMENDNNQLFTAAQIYAVAVDVADGTEDGKLIINTMKNGTSTAALTISELGTATFGGNIVIPDDGTIGSASDTDAIAIRSDGNVGIRNAGNSAISLQVTGTGTDTVIQCASGGHGLDGRAGTSAAYVGTMGFAFDTAHYGYLGYSTIGCYATSITTPGVLSKGSGSFRIPHGLREDYDLIHSFIEGPQCDLIYRGRATLVDGQATVSMDTKYEMTAGTFEWLTKADDVQTFTSNETGWDAVKSSFSGDTITIECQNADSTDTISWMVVAERGDPNIISSTLTDDEGNLIIERPSEPEPPLPSDFEPPPED